MTAARWTVTTMLGLGLLCLAFAPRASAAEPERRWQMWEQLPGKEWKPRGKALAEATACALDLASHSNVVPSGTKLACLRVAEPKLVTR